MLSDWIVILAAEINDCKLIESKMFISVNSKDLVKNLNLSLYSYIPKMFRLLDWVILKFFNLITSQP